MNERFLFMPTYILNETMNNEMLVKYMLLPAVIGVGVVMLASIFVNVLKVSLLQKWVANVNTNSNQNSQLEDSDSGVYEPEDEDAQRIANIYKDF